MKAPRKRPAPTDKPRRYGWSKTCETIFLEALMDVPRVSRAIELCGISKPQLYRRRASHPEFAMAWDDAVRCGRLRLDSALLWNAIDVSERGGIEGELAVAPMTMAQAIQVRKLYPVEDAAPAHITQADGEAGFARLTKMVLAVKNSGAGDDPAAP